MDEFRAQPSATSITIYPTVGLQSAIHVGQRRILRFGSSGANQSLNCNADQAATSGRCSGRVHSVVHRQQVCRPALVVPAH